MKRAACVVCGYEDTVDSVKPCPLHNEPHCGACCEDCMQSQTGE